MSSDEFTAPAPPGSSPVEYASFRRRLGAACLDSLVWIVGLLFYNPLVYVGLDRTGAAIAGLVILSAWFNYYAFCEWRWGQTIGKNATGIRVLALDGGKLTWQAAAVRNLLRLIDFPLTLIGVDYLLYENSPRRQRLGDRAAKTVVIREPPKVAPAVASGNPTATASEVPGSPASVVEGSGPPSAALGAIHTGPNPPGGPGDGKAEGGPDPSPPTSEFPYTTWSLSRTFGGVLLGLALALFLPLLVLPFDHNLGKDNASAAANIVAQLLSEFGLLGAALWIASTAAPHLQRAVHAGFERLGYHRFHRSGLGWAALGFVAYFVFLVAYISVIGKPHQRNIAQDFGPVVFQVLLISIVAPICEETFFRGMLFGGLRRRMPPIPAALISGLIFGGLHAGTGVSAIPVLVVFGVVLALVYERTRSLGPGMILHAFNNTLALL